MLTGCRIRSGWFTVLTGGWLWLLIISDMAKPPFISSTEIILASAWTFTFNFGDVILCPSFLPPYLSHLFDNKHVIKRGRDTLSLFYLTKKLIYLFSNRLKPEIEKDNREGQSITSPSLKRIFTRPAIPLWRFWALSFALFLFRGRSFFFAFKQFEGAIQDESGSYHQDCNSNWSIEKGRFGLGCSRGFLTKSRCASSFECQR